MSELEPITREEKLLDGQDLEPVTRREKFIKKIYDKTQTIPEPVTREEIFLKKAGESGGDVTIKELTVTENGDYSEEDTAYSPVHVEVPQPTLSTLEVSENGDYDAPSGTAYNRVEVEVPLPQNAYLLKSVNTPTPIASFNDGEEMVMPSLKVAIEPQQEGSGDPSPTNVRPISGWTEEVITRTRKNLCNNSTNIEGFYDNVGSFINDNTKRSSQPIKVNPLTTYSGSIFDTDTNDRVNNVVYTEWDKNGDFIQQIATASITTSANTAYIRIRNYEAQASLVQSNHYAYQLEESNESTTYEPYAGTTYTIALGDTYYGGYIDWANNCLVVNRGYVDLGSFSAESWTRNGVQLFWSHTIEGMAEGTANVMCSEYKYVSKSWTALVDYEFGVSSNSIRLHNENVSTKEELANSLDGVQLVYELATPLTIQLTPTAVKSLLGQNNIWADTGDITDAEYFSKEV